MGEDQIQAWAEGMYHRLYANIPPGDRERFHAAYDMEVGVIHSFMGTVEPGIPMIAEMPEEEAQQYLEWVFQVFMAGWGQGIAWVQARQPFS